MEIIDSQIGRIQLPKPWEFGEPSATALAVELSREAMDCVGVDVGVFQGNIAFLEAACQRHPGRFRGAVTIRGEDVRRPDMAEFIAGLRQRPGILAVRTLIRTWRDEKIYPAFADGGYEPLFAACEANQVPVFIAASGYLPQIHSIVKKYARLTFILDHLGLKQQPNVVASDPWEELPQVLEMAQFPNVAIKFCGAVTFAKEPYPFRDLWSHLHKIVRAYGPERLMWGSDFNRLRFAPGDDKLGDRKGWYGLYSDSVNFLRDTDELSAGDKEMIFSGTIRRLLRWQ